MTHVDYQALRLAYFQARALAIRAGGIAIATRYSGDVSVTLIYRDFQRDYACRVVSPDGHRTVLVKSSPGCVLDSREAFDETARIAIAFAYGDGLDVQGAEHKNGTLVVSSDWRRVT